MPDVIENYLSDRVFKVRLFSTLSELFEQDNSVPQGSILSVILFIIKINKLTQIIKACLDKSLFVDDLSVSCVGRTMWSVQRQLQLCLDRIQQWANENGFRFSKSKTVCVHFCQQRRCHLDPELKIKAHLYQLSHKQSFWVSFMTKSWISKPTLTTLGESVRKVSICWELSPN